MAIHKARILLVEDEDAQREVLAYSLKSEGYDVIEAANGDDAMLAVIEQAPDLLILDWMLPGLSGIEIARRVKAAKTTANTPILMLSARSEDTDLVRGLDMGADDYISKPYALSELTARVRALLRRTAPALAGNTVTFLDLVLDSGAHKVTRNGETIALGPTEFRLLATFMERPGQVFSRDQLLDRVWGRDTYIDTRTVDVHVGRLRKAITSTGAPDVLRTVRGVGYALG